MLYQKFLQTFAGEYLNYIYVSFLIINYRQEVLPIEKGTVGYERETIMVAKLIINRVI